MRPKEMNPISKKIKRLIENKEIMLEHICVKTGISYPTLSNIFHPHRCDRISNATLTVFKACLKNIITEQDIEDYYVFRRKFVKKKKIKVKKENITPIMEEDYETESSCFEDKCGVETEDDRTGIEPEICE